MVMVLDERTARESPASAPDTVLNWIGNRLVPARSGETLTKCDPVTGRSLCEVARSRAEDVQAAVRAAREAFEPWSSQTVVRRGEILRNAAAALQARAEEFAHVVHVETGKSLKDARGEVGAAVEMGFFVAGEGRRFYGKTTTSATPHKNASIQRQPLGVAGLIIAANTPIANVAWKAFPALLCGNTAVMKPSEDTPYTALAFAELLRDAGLPPGVFNLVQGLGAEAGAPLVESPEVNIVSFTGSCGVGRWVARTAGERLAKVCLELGGKNPLVVCDDADLNRAVEAAALAAFSNAGQRCAAGSRMLVFDSVYERFKTAFVAKAESLRLGNHDGDDLGPVINERHLNNMLAAVRRAEAAGARVLCGGRRADDPALRDGYFMLPTVIEGAAHEDEITRSELFGPITCLYRVRDFDEAVRLANDSPFGLTASLHTRSLDRAMTWIERIRCGVAVVNGPTHGSEPHMPFGGLRQSGNGAREAGTEALDVYSDWKTVYINFDPSVA